MGDPFVDAGVNLHHMDGKLEAANAAAAAPYESARLELEHFFGPKDGFVDPKMASAG